jgi:hypothetical protein
MSVFHSLCQLQRLGVEDLGLPAAAQQGRNDPMIVPRDWTMLPPKSNERRAVSPRKDTALKTIKQGIKAFRRGGS